MSSIEWNPRGWSRRAQVGAAGGASALVAAGVAIAVSVAMSGPAGVSGAGSVDGDAASDPSATPTLSNGLLTYPLGGRGPATIDVDWDATLPAPATVPVEPLPGFADPLGPTRTLADDFPRFPASAVATDAVWDAAGAGWLVAVYGPAARGFSDVDAAGFSDVSSRAYLVSPQGTHYAMWWASPADYADWNLPTYSIDAVYPEMGWVVLSGEPLRAETHSPNFVEVRDLRTGEILVTGGQSEGSPVGERRDIGGPLADGSYVWLDSGSEDGGAVTLTRRLPDGSLREVPLPRDAVGPLAMHDLGDGTFVISHPWSEPDRRVAWSYDAATGAVSDATGVVRAGDARCWIERARDGLILRTCDEPFRYEWVDITGAVRQPFADDELYDDARERLREYAALGFSVSVVYDEATTLLSRAVDISTGRPAFSERQCPGVGEVLLWNAPQDLGDGRFALVCPHTKAVLAYDRHVGESFVLIPGEFAGVRSGLASFAGYTTPEYAGPVASSDVVVTPTDGTAEALAPSVVGRTRTVTPAIIATVGDLWAIESQLDPVSMRTAVYLRSPAGEHYLSHTLMRATPVVAWDPRTMLAVTEDGRSELNIATGEVTALDPRGGTVVGDGLATGRAFLINSEWGPAAVWTPGAGWTPIDSLAGLSDYHVLADAPRSLGSTWVVLVPNWDIESPESHPRVFADLSGQYPAHALSPSMDANCSVEGEREPGVLMLSCAEWRNDGVATRLVQVDGPLGSETAVDRIFTTAEAARVYGTFQMADTPLVLDTDTAGGVTGASVLSTAGLTPLRTALAERPLYLTGFHELRAGTYALTFHQAVDHPGGTPDAWFTEPERRIVIVDILTGTVVGDTPLPSGTWPGRTITYVAPESDEG